jgi:hypothetical protein
MKRIALALSLSMLLMVFVPQASAAVTTKQIIPFDQTVTTCSGEALRISGEFIEVEHFNLDSTGVSHFSGVLQWRNVTAVSDSGVTYRGIDGFANITRIDAATGFYNLLTLAGRFMLVSENGDQNLKASFTIHETLLPDGHTIVVDRTDIGCVG